MNFKKVVFFLISCSSIAMLKASSDESELSGRTLVEAVRNADSNAVRILLADGGDVDQVDSDGNPLICIAAEKGDIETVRLLLGAGADPNRVNAFAENALIRAQEGPHWNVTACLLAAGAQLGNWASQLDGMEQARMRILITMGQRSIPTRASAIRNWLDWEAKKHSYCDVGKEGQKFYAEFPTGLQELVGRFEGSSVSEKQVSDIIKANEDFTDIRVQEGRPYGEIPLCDAAALGHYDSVRGILENGSDVDATKDSTDCTPLIEALRNYFYSDHDCSQRLEVVRLLLAYGANVHATLPSGQTVLGEALQEGYYWDAAEILLSAGAQIDGTTLPEDMEGEREMLWEYAEECIPARSNAIRQWLNKQAQQHIRQVDGKVYHYSEMPVVLQELISEFDGSPVSMQQVEKSLQQIKAYLGQTEQDEEPRRKRRRLN